MAFDTIHQILITHTGKSMSSASDSIDYGRRSLYIYHFELGKFQNSWQTCLVLMSCSASMFASDLTLWNCRSMLVEVLFNVGTTSVSNDGPVDGWVFRYRDSPRSSFKGQFILWSIRHLFILFSSQFSRNARLEMYVSNTDPHSCNLTS
jgi:hypothetical protein